MLELELGGKTVTTMDEIQTIKINGNLVEIERVGNRIYVNKEAINLIVVDVKNRWKSVLMLGILIFTIAAIIYLAVANRVLIVEGGNAVMNFIQTSVVPSIESIADTPYGLINGNETATSTDPSRQ